VEESLSMRNKIEMDSFKRDLNEKNQMIEWEFFLQHAFVLFD
jgi:hypothetical protein